MLRCCFAIIGCLKMYNIRTTQKKDVDKIVYLMAPGATDITRVWMAQAIRCPGCEETRGAPKKLFH